MRYPILLRELPGKQSGGRLHSVPLSSATRNTLVTSLLRPARGAFRGLSPLAARHCTDACRRLAWQQVIAHLFRRGLLAVPPSAGIATIGRRGLLAGHGRISTGQEGQHFPHGAFPGSGFRQREVCLDVVAVAAAVLLLDHVAGLDRVRDSAEGAALGDVHPA